MLGCIIRTYGVFHDIRQVSLGLVGKFSHSTSPTRDNIVDCLVDAFGKMFFVDDAAETLLSYVVELCGEVSVSVTHLVISTLYILGYEVLDRVKVANRIMKKNNAGQEAPLGFKLADENFDASSMFT